MTIYYLVFAIGIFLVLRYLSRVLASVTSNRRVLKGLIRTFPLIELIVWLAFGLFVLSRLFSDMEYYPVLVSAVAIGLVLIVSWYFLRDFISGIILKTEIPFTENQQIGVLDKMGILRKVGYRSIEVETGKGELVKIPYSHLASDSIRLFSKNESVQAYELKLTVENTIALSEAKSRIAQAMLLLPWVVTHRDPLVSLEHQTDTQNTFLVSYYTTSDNYSSFINQHLIKQFTDGKL